MLLLLSLVKADAATYLCTLPLGYSTANLACQKWNGISTGAGAGCTAAALGSPGVLTCTLTITAGAAAAAAAAIGAQGTGTVTCPSNGGTFVWSGSAPTGCPNWCTLPPGLRVGVVAAAGAAPTAYQPAFQSCLAGNTGCAFTAAAIPFGATTGLACVEPIITTQAPCDTDANCQVGAGNAVNTAANFVCATNGGTFTFAGTLVLSRINNCRTVCTLPPAFVSAGAVASAAEPAAANLWPCTATQGGCSTTLFTGGNIACKTAGSVAAQAVPAAFGTATQGVGAVTCAAATTGAPNQFVWATSAPFGCGCDTANPTMGNCTAVTNISQTCQCAASANAQTLNSPFGAVCGTTPSATMPSGPMPPGFATQLYNASVTINCTQTPCPASTDFTNCTGTQAQGTYCAFSACPTRQALNWTTAFCNNSAVYNYSKTCYTVNCTGFADSNCTSDSYAPGTVCSFNQCPSGQYLSAGATAKCQANLTYSGSRICSTPPAASATAPLGVNKACSCDTNSTVTRPAGAVCVTTCGARGRTAVNPLDGTIVCPQPTIAEACACCRAASAAGTASSCGFQTVAGGPITPCDGGSKKGLLGLLGLLGLIPLLLLCLLCICCLLRRKKRRGQMMMINQAVAQPPPPPPVAVPMGDFGAAPFPCGAPGAPVFAP